MSAYTAEQLAADLDALASKHCITQQEKTQLNEVLSAAIKSANYQSYLPLLAHDMKEFVRLGEDLAQTGQFPFMDKKLGGTIKDINGTLLLLNSRARRTQAIERDAVALSFFPLANGAIQLLAEDPKGRTIPMITWAEPKSTSYTPPELNGQQPPTLNMLDLRNVKVNSAISPTLLKAADLIKQNIVLATLDPRAANKQAIDSIFKNYREETFPGALVAPISATSQIIHDHLNNLDPTILNHISNGARVGVTARTAHRHIKNALAKTQGNNPVTMEKALLDLFNHKDLNKYKIDISTSWIERTAQWVSQAEPSTQQTKVFNAFCTTPLAFNNKASGKSMKHTKGEKNDFIPESQGTPEAPKKAKPSGRSPTAMPVGDESPATAPAMTVPMSALKEIFGQYQDSMSAEQLSHKLIEVLSGGRLLPLTSDDIQSIHHTVRKMQDRPHSVDNGMHWLCDIADDATARNSPNTDAPDTREPEQHLRRSR